jgi:hypothetical protein
LHVRLMKKKSLKSICMVGTRMIEYIKNATDLQGL